MIESMFSMVIWVVKFSSRGDAKLQRLLHKNQINDAQFKGIEVGYNYKP